MAKFQIRRRIWLVFSALLLLCLAAPTSLLGQVDTGGVTGTVTDSTGAVVPGAQITLTNTATHIVETSKSTSTGSYSFNGVRPGTYDLKGEAPGFKIF